MRERIISEIKRIADEVGRAPGQNLFEAHSGIKVREWRGKYWARWNNALAEAGYDPNALNAKIDVSLLFRGLAEVCLNLKKMPTEDEYRLFRRKP